MDVQDNAYGDGFGWKFLIDATLTATRIRDQTREKVATIKMHFDRQTVGRSVDRS